MQKSIILRFAFLLLLLTQTMACNGQPTHLPVETEDGWKVAAPADVGLDAVLIGRLQRDAAGGRFPNLHGLVVVKDGKLVLDAYFDGYDRDDRHYTASVTKSVASILLGMVMDQGGLDGLDEGILDQPLQYVFPAHKAMLTDDLQKQAIRLRHILSMSAGFAWDEQSHPYNDRRNDWVQTRTSDDPVGFVFSKPMAAEPGTVFNYSGGLSVMLSYLIERGSGMRADRFGEKYLFEPLGITDYEWEILDGGLADTPGGLHLRPRDMAKIGQLYLKGGVWNGKRLVSEAWVEVSTQEHMINTDSPNYGFQWWCGDFHYEGRSAYAFLASGHGGQKVFVFPAFGLVAVLTHEVFNNPVGELANLAILTRYLLPAADPQGEPETPITLEATSLQRYVGTYSSDVGELTIGLQDGQLYAEAERSPRITLTSQSETVFLGTVQNLLDVRFTFDLPEDGPAASVLAAYGFSSRSFHR